MGFDLYGINPTVNKEYPPRYNQIMKEYGKDGWIDWTKNVPEDVKEEYFELKNQFEEDNPGDYFRNNVWWWRPLWQCIGSSCDDILSEDDITGGYFNDGHTISKEQAVAIAERMKSLIENGTINDYKLEYDKSSTALPEDDFMKNYSFTVDNLQEFIRFCEGSGGFEIW